MLVVFGADFKFDYCVCVGSLGSNCCCFQWENLHLPFQYDLLTVIVSGGVSLIFFLHMEYCWFLRITDKIFYKQQQKRQSLPPPSQETSSQPLKILSFQSLSKELLNDRSWREEYRLAPCVSVTDESIFPRDTWHANGMYGMTMECMMQWAMQYHRMSWNVWNVMEWCNHRMSWNVMEWIPIHAPHFFGNNWKLQKSTGDNIWIDVWKS